MHKNEFDTKVYRHKTYLCIQFYKGLGTRMKRSKVIETQHSIDHIGGRCYDASINSKGYLISVLFTVAK